MSAIETFSFGRYTLRPAGRDQWDRALAVEWTAADPDHAGRVDPGFWLEQYLGRDSYLLLDDQGPLFFFKLISYGPNVEIHIQFRPIPKSELQLIEHRRRITRGLLEGITWLERILIQSEIEEMCFDSINESLIAFATKRLGFVLRGGRLRKRLEAVQRPYLVMERKA